MATQTVTRKAKCGVLTRAAEVERFGNVEVRDGQTTQEVELSLSSEHPVERWFGMEVLGHGADEVRLSRLNNGGPLLLNHNTDDQIGAFKRDSVEVGDDKKLRGVARFSRSARAKEIADDVELGIRGATSIGYRVHKFERAHDLETVDPNTDDVEVKYWRAVDWEPLEGSIVPVPADPNVGAGRFMDEEHEVVFVDTETKKDTPVMEPEIKVTKPDENKPDEEAIRKNAATSERERIAEIEAVGEKFKLDPKRVRQAIEAGTPADAFRKEVFATWKPEDIRTADANVGMTGREVQRFSLCKAVNAMLSNDWRKAEFEQECIRAAQDKHDAMGLNVEANSITVPLEVQTSASRAELGMQKRANLTAGTAEGTELVGTDHLGQQFIDALRNRVQVMNAGATVLSGLVGNVSIPRQVAGIAAGISATETGTYTEGAPTYDNVTMSPKIVNAFQPVSRQLLIQGSPDVETMLRRDLTLALGLQLDFQALYGTGASGQATGIENQTGVYALNFGEVAATWDKVVEGETGIASANADVGDMKWILHAKTRGKWKTTVKVSGVAEYLWDTRTPEAPVNGYGALISNQVDDATGTGAAFSEGFFGVWPQAVYGLWGGMSLLVDPYTNATTHLVRLIVHQHFDFMVRHGEAFAFCTGIQN